MSEPIPECHAPRPEAQDAWVGEQWRRLCERAPGAMAVFDREVRYLAASAAWLSNYEAGRPDVRGKSYYALHPRAPERWRAVHARALAGETCREDQEHFVLEDGSEVWSRWVCAPWQYHDGRIGGIVVTTENLTALEQARRRLNVAEQELHLALEAARAGTWEVDLGTHASKWSPETWRLYGLEPDQVEASADAWRRTIVPEDRERIYQAAMAAIERRQDVEGEWRVDLPDDERWLFFRGRPVTERDGRVDRYIGVVIDVTARKKAEQLAAAREQELRSVLDALPVGVAHVDRDLRYRYANLRYAACFGRSREDVLGRTAAEVIGTETIARAAPDIRAVLAGQPRSFTLLATLPDGRRRILQVDLVPEPVGAGSTAGYFAIVLDKTEQEAADAELARAREQLEQFTRRHVAEQTVMAVAHELRQPLHAAANFTEAVPVMLDQEMPAAQVAQVVARAGEEIRRANRVLSQLFDFVRAARASGGGTHAPAPLNDLVHRALAQFRAEHGAALSCAVLDLGEDAGRIACDAVTVEKIILILLRNATEALGCGAACKAGARILVQTRRMDGRVRLRVEDNGGGVAPEVRPQLFQPFHSTKSGGLGLGLSICRQLVELHGGGIWHEDRPGGSAFVVDWPAAP